MSTHKLISVTLDPSLDRTVITPFLALGYENRFAKLGGLDPAGRGINVSRALHQFDVSTESILLLGNDATATAYMALIAQEDFDCLVIQVEGYTRSSLIIYEENTHTETQIIEESTEVNADDIQAVSDLIAQRIEQADWVLFAGGLPSGISDETYAYLTDKAQVAGAKVALFGLGRLWDETFKSNPDLIILSTKELEAYLNYPVRTIDDMVGAAKKLQGLGAQDILIFNPSQGDGIFHEQTNTWQFSIPQSETGTTSGVWDALVGGFFHGYLKHASSEVALRMAGAAAFYTHSQIGSTFGTVQDIEAYLANVTVSIVDPKPAAPAMV